VYLKVSAPTSKEMNPTVLSLCLAALLSVSLPVAYCQSVAEQQASVALGASPVPVTMESIAAKKLQVLKMPFDRVATLAAAFLAQTGVDSTFGMRPIDEIAVATGKRRQTQSYLVGGICYNCCLCYLEAPNQCGPPSLYEPPDGLC
jgi:hypothetical protein